MVPQTVQLPMSSANLRIRRSVLDRLLASSGDVPEGLMMTCTVEQLRDSVARDLEALLNSRTAFDFDAMHLTPHARDSVLTFGVRDFVGRVLRNGEDQRFICASLAKAIETHEPRLTHVRVDFNEKVNESSRSTNSLAFTIRAVLIVHPAKESVSFDAVLQPSISRFALTAARFVPGL